ncbi:WD40 repeat domain-containing protein [Nocardia sp. NPDC051570]|uniref:WD40 repeat domain-containing protein n=1 Tax=Nocardia sp. NPDC051570 TaxID=3364324 RepID=UPI0037AB782F
MAFSPDGTLVAANSPGDHIVQFLDARTHEQLQPVHDDTNMLYSIAFSPDSTLLVTARSDGSVRLWNVHARQPDGQPLLINHSGETVGSVTFSPDGTRLAVGSADTVQLWDIGTRQPAGPPLTGHTSTVRAVAFSPNGALLASTGEDRTIRLWDVHRHQPAGQPLTGHTDKVESVAFSPDGTLLATGSADKTVRLWNAP